MSITIYKDRQSLKTCSNVCHLSIQVDLNGFFLLAYHSQLQKFIFFQHITFKYPNPQNYHYHKNLETALLQTEILKYSFYRMTCLYYPAHQTNVPTPLFHPEKAIQLINLTSSYHEDEELHFHTLPFYDLTHIFSIPSFIISTLSSYNSQIQFYSTTLTHLHILHKLSAHQQQKVIFLVDFSPSFYQISVTCEQKLLFVQHFLYHTEADIISTVQTIINHHQLKNDQVMIYCIGTLFIDTPFYTKFKKHFFHLHILEYFPQRLFSSSLEKIHNHWLPHLMYGHLLKNY